MSIYIFTGPTLSREAVCAEVDAVCLPPVSHGDVYRVGLKRPRAIGIIDGYFEGGRYEPSLGVAPPPTPAQWCAMSPGHPQWPGWPNPSSAGCRG